jgi:serine protease Do
LDAASARWFTLLCVGAVAVAQEAPSVAESLATEVRAVFARAGRAVVRIEAEDKHGQLSGSGFFIDPAGTLYTSYTIGGESTDLVVRFGEQKYPARRVFADARSGIALLKVDATETPFVATGESRSLALGSPVIAIGYPMDLPLTPSFGTIGGFDIKYLDRYFATAHLRANVPVQRGEGGAPVVNMRGEAVGILISSLDQGSACFVLPIEAAEKLRKDHLRHGELRPGWLGIGVEPADTPQAGSVAAISALNIGAPGQKAGLKTGDILLHVGDHAITSPEDVLDASFFIAAEDEVKIRVARDGEALDFMLTAVDGPNTSARTARDVATFGAHLGTSDLRGVPVKLEQ